MRCAWRSSRTSPFALSDCVGLAVLVFFALFAVALALDTAAPIAGHAAAVAPAPGAVAVAAVVIVGLAFAGGGHHSFPSDKDCAADVDGEEKAAGPVAARDS